MLNPITDLRHIEQWPVKIGPNVTLVDSDNKPNDIFIMQGEWVRVNGDDEITRITADLDTPDAFPVWTNTKRHDSPFVDRLTILRGYHFTATTDRYLKTANIVTGSPLMVTGDDRTAAQGGEGGWLTLATAGKLIRAIALKVDSTNNILTFRFQDGWTKQS